jgi:predicted phosphohydrolase
MSIWAIADLHLSFGVENKSMDFFGPAWADHAARIEEKWREVIKPDDLVLIAGDISWAMKVKDAVPDLNWIHSLPGTKVILKGNHDFWWESLSKIAPFIPASIHLIQNNTYTWNDVCIGGTRLWDTEEYAFGSFIQFRENPRQKVKDEVAIAAKKEEAEKIFERELQRLEMSLNLMDPHAKHKIAMTHYPPIGSDLSESKASAILEKHKIDICVFGHLHNIKEGIELFGEARGIKYVLTSCDYLHFNPIRLL